MKVVETASISSRIELAFQSASTTTGTDFGYLVKTAARESNFDASAKARTSSATGLFQFIESTWLETVKASGAAHGLGEYAKDIRQLSNGKYVVSDPQRRREILDLRKDPEISARMAGELTRKNAAYLEQRLGRAPSEGELYVAHFLGAGGASKLIAAAERTPDHAANKIFPRQARANRSIFYERSGAPRSVSQVLAGLVRQHDGTGPVVAKTAVAQAAPTPIAKARAIAGLTAFGADYPSGAGGIAPSASAKAPTFSDTVLESRVLRATASTADRRLAGTAPVVAEAAALGERRQAESGTAVPAATALPATGPVAPEAAVAAEVRAAQVPEAGATGAVNGQGARPVQSQTVQSQSAQAETTQAVAAAPVPPMPTAPQVAATRLAAVEAKTTGTPPTQLPAREPAAEADGPAAQGAEPGASASERIRQAWHAASPDSPFQALFRNDPASTRERFDSTFVTAFAAQPDALRAAVAERASAERTDVADSVTESTQAAQDDGRQAAAPQPPARPERGPGEPFDLTGFLRYQIFKEPEDLVPPA